MNPDCDVQRPQAQPRPVPASPTHEMPIIECQSPHTHLLDVVTARPRSELPETPAPTKDLPECVVISSDCQLQSSQPCCLQPPFRGRCMHKPPIQEATTFGVRQKSPLRGGSDGVFGDSFEDSSVRQAFIRKVYAILAVQLFFTTVVIGVCVLVPSVKDFVRRHILLFILASVMETVLYFVLVCFDSVRRKFPLNFVLLTIFTMLLAYVTGTISAFYDTQIVLFTFAITTGVCVLVSFIAIFSCVDITGCGAVLCLLGLVVMVFGMFSIFMTIFFGVPILLLIYSGLVAMLMCVYLMYDTQQIIGGRSVEMSPEEYIYGAIQLYVDIVQLFTALLYIINFFFGSDD